MSELVPWLGSIALFAALMSGTPGPNNMMLTASGIRFGFHRTIPHILGIQAGVICQIGLVAAGLGVLAAEPRVQLALKVLGTLYLLWLAWHFWRQAELSDASLGDPIGFWRAAAFQFVNPKAWVMSLTLIAGFVVPGENYLQQVLLAVLIFTLIGTPSCAVWAAFGAALRRWLSNPRTLTVVNRALAILTALTCILFWL